MKTNNTMNILDPHEILNSPEHVRLATLLPDGEYRKYTDWLREMIEKNNEAMKDHCLHVLAVAEECRYKPLTLKDKK